MPSHQERREPLPKGYQFGDAANEEGMILVWKDIPVEIISRYESGEREIVVSHRTFAAYDDATLKKRGFMNRVGGTRPFNEQPTTMYKDAKVIRSMK